MLVKSSLSPAVVSLSPNSLEFIVTSIKFHNRSLYIGTYRPPSSPLDISSLSSTLSNLRSSILANLILVGDFNVHYTTTSSSNLLYELTSIADTCSLRQIITEPTHYSHTGSPSIIDLVFVPSTFSSTFQILPPVSSSDHNSILFAVSLPRSSSPNSPKSPHRRIWLYNRADVNRINHLLSLTQWESILSSDVNASWYSFKLHFLKIMTTCIPSKLLPRSPLPPWINCLLAAKLRAHQRLYRIAKATSSPSLLSLYRSLRNHISSSIKHPFCTPCPIVPPLNSGPL